MSCIYAELLLNRLLSASTPTDCLDSLDQLQSQCRHNNNNSHTISKNKNDDPKKQRPSHQQVGTARDEAEAKKVEDERKSIAVDTLLRNASALNALCNLVASSTLPCGGTTSGGNSNNNGMEVEGGDVAACELLLVVLPIATASDSSLKDSASCGGMNTETLNKQ